MENDNQILLKMAVYDFYFIFRLELFGAQCVVVLCGKWSQCT